MRWRETRNVGRVTPTAYRAAGTPVLTPTGSHRVTRTGLRTSASRTPLQTQRREHIMSEPEIVKELEDISALFVQTAHAAEHLDGRIILRSVTPSTLYFSDRPQR